MSSAKDYPRELENLISELILQPDREPVASELGVLQSIYGEDAIRLWHPSEANLDNCDGIYLETVRYEVIAALPPPYENVQVRILVSLPPSYPSLSPPQLQLLSKYIGAFGVDSDLFGYVLRTFISTNGVKWTADTVCVFDGVQNVIERCVSWYEHRSSKDIAVEQTPGDSTEEADTSLESPELETRTPDLSLAPPVQIPEQCEVVEAEAIMDRKSVFVGRACRITHPSQVPLILSNLATDRRISRATHPIINAWRCRLGNLLYQDNADDGETAAGGCLAHLLQILEVENVLVVVTRYFGGIPLGPDRFKHIKQAARNALELGGFLDASEPKKNSRRGRKP